MGYSFQPGPRLLPLTFAPTVITYQFQGVGLCLLFVKLCHRSGYLASADTSRSCIQIIANSIKSTGANLIVNMDDLQQGWYNSLVHDHLKISAVFRLPIPYLGTSNCQLPAYYNNFKKFVHFNLWCLRIAIHSILQISNPDDVGNDRYMLHPRAETPINKFDNYRW
jgi:hypothetical protein